MYVINKYIILLKKEKLATYFCVAPILGLLGIVCYYELKASFALWTFLIIALIIGVIAEYWLYKRYYDTNIQSLRKSLEEMKELKEE
jgi:ABC-type maltose transport system permease subunit